ncbi:MAG: ankyrin repeat domain-containing protein [Rhodospirillales bacterium]|nr:ankyrin repeat domain-containing protein [Rhodospirillales bacterium]
MSPLLLAVRNGHFELAVELIKAGADPNDQRTGFAPLKGRRAFFLAADRADAALMEQLLELGADPFLPNAELSTP